ncbi:MAG: oligosaccharyl transferase, archaeosortase A system-associated [Methanoregulaceae archaeon]
MEGTAPDKRHIYLIIGIIVLFMAFALVLRGLPALATSSQDFFPVYDSDTWYNLRQVEAMVADFPHYNWFDPMLAYPEGKTIDWGPLYPTLAAALCIATGATTRAAIISHSMWLSPLLAAFMVPVVFLTGRYLWGTRTGLIAAGLISFVSFRYFFLSSYGIVDHHTAEVVTTSLFLLAYIGAVWHSRKDEIDWSFRKTLAIPAGLSFLAGLLLFLGLLASPTTTLILIVIAVFTLVQISADYAKGRFSDSLLLINVISMGTAFLCYLAYGVKAEGMSLIQYTAGHFYLYAVIIGETIFLTLLARLGRKYRPAYWISLCIVAGAVFLAIPLVPSLSVVMNEGLGLILSGDASYSLGVQETAPWTVASAFTNQNAALLLMAGGLCLAAFRYARTWRRELAILLVWACVMLFLTAGHRRFEYYLAVPLVLLSAICIDEAVCAIEPWFRSRYRARIRKEGTESNAEHDPASQSGSRNAVPGKKGRSGKIPSSPDNRSKMGYPVLIAGILVLCLTGVMIVISTGQDLVYGLSANDREISPDWLESLSWLETHTPDPGVGYYARYEQGNFTYPGSSYGVLAPWDTGHWVMFFAQRIPIMTPFQNNLYGSDGGAAFYLAGNESRAENILSGLGARYVITDARSSVDTFLSLIPWVDPAYDTTPYVKGILARDPANPKNLVLQNQYDNAYFQSMMVRLQEFDGSLVEPDTVQYIEYEVRQVPASGETSPLSGPAPVIRASTLMNATSAEQAAAAWNAQNISGSGVIILSDRPDKPVQELPALRHFRLIHESPANATVSVNGGSVQLPGVKTVKIFEYVRGAHIMGTGIISLPVTTNTGREFVYLQKSTDGEFIVPYATEGNSSGVHATGPYRILGTSLTYQVSGNDVLNGTTVH